MKKILLFIGLSMFSFGAFADKVPAVVVNKSQGGFTALLNLYNYVTYTPASLSSTGVGQLDCVGSGYTACRVPNCVSFPVNDGTTVYTETNLSRVQSFTQCINDVLVQYEAAQAQQAHDMANGNSAKGASIPSSYSKTIAFPGSTTQNHKKVAMETYVVRGVVTSSNNSASTMKIYIEKVNLLPSVNAH